MKRTFTTVMPDRIGAFLKADQCLANLGLNITRVSYNKALDKHTLFIEAEGSEEQLDKAAAELTEMGYLNKNTAFGDVSIFVFILCITSLLLRFVVYLLFVKSTPNKLVLLVFCLNLIYSVAAFVNHSKHR
jgi:hypothetical protein